MNNEAPSWQPGMAFTPSNSNRDRAATGSNAYRPQVHSAPGTLAASAQSFVSAQSALYSLPAGAHAAVYETAEASYNAPGDVGYGSHLHMGSGQYPGSIPHSQI